MSLEKQTKRAFTEAKRMYVGIVALSATLPEARAWKLRCAAASTAVNLAMALRCLERRNDPPQ
jgi:hypothetical protein